MPLVSLATKLYCTRS